METEASVAFSPAPKEALLLDWTAAIQEVCLRQWPSGSTYASGEANRGAESSDHPSLLRRSNFWSRAYNPSLQQSCTVRKMGDVQN